MRAAMVLGAALLWGGAAVAEGPSFDCGKAANSAETLICGDAQLAALDRETARLFGLARDGADTTPDRRTELIAGQPDWISARDRCVEASDPRACVLDAYVQRIQDLRQGYAMARDDDAAGISIGPLTADCPGFGAAMSVTFVNTDPPLAYLAWRDQSLLLTEGPTGSGARYVATDTRGETVFWVKGDEATFDRPGAAALTCAISPPG